MGAGCKGNVQFDEIALGDDDFFVAVDGRVVADAVVHRDARREGDPCNTRHADGSGHRRLESEQFEEAELAYSSVATMEHERRYTALAAATKCWPTIMSAKQAEPAAAASAAVRFAFEHNPPFLRALPSSSFLPLYTFSTSARINVSPSLHTSMVFEPTLQAASTCWRMPACTRGCQVSSSQGSGPVWQGRAAPPSIHTVSLKLGGCRRSSERNVAPCTAATPKSAQEEARQAQSGAGLRRVGQLSRNKGRHRDHGEEGGKYCQLTRGHFSGRLVLRRQPGGKDAGRLARQQKKTRSAYVAPLYGARGNWEGKLGRGACVLRSRRQTANKVAFGIRMGARVGPVRGEGEASEKTDRQTGGQSTGGWSGEGTKHRARHPVAHRAPEPGRVHVLW